MQIPYETPVNRASIVTVNNNGLSVSATINVAAAAPGLFTDAAGVVVPSATVARGGVAVLYLTGAGAVSPAISTGAAPAAGTAIAQLPAPVQSTTVSIGGVPGIIQFDGIPAALVGVTQINVLLPSSVPLGTQQVVATVGGVSSAPATITVTP